MISINNNNYNINIQNNNEDDKKVEKEEENENQFLALIHIFLKNLEANHIITEILENKIIIIFQSFD